MFAGGGKLDGLMSTGVLEPWFKKWRIDAVLLGPGRADLHLGRGGSPRPDTLMQTGLVTCQPLAPAVAPPAGVRCSQVLAAVANCAALGFSLVYAPAVLADVALTDGADAAGTAQRARYCERPPVCRDAGRNIYMLSP
jgi:hypothetical protein